MPENIAAREAKDRIISRLNGASSVGFVQKGRSKDWIISLNGNASVFLTYSIYHPQQRGYWYDLAVKDILDMDEYKKALIIFLLGNSDRLVVIHMEEMFRLIKENGGTKIASDGTVKIHINRRDGEFVLKEAGNTSLSGYINRLDLATD
jgi:hypothetical protein